MTRMTEDDRLLVREVGARLRAERRRLELRQADVAAMMGLVYQQVQLMEAGKQNIPLPTYLSWCDALGVEPWEPLGWRAPDGERQIG